MLPVGIVPLTALFGLPVRPTLYEQGFGETVTIAGNQLLPPTFSASGRDFAGKGLGFRPLLAVEGEFCQVACVRWQCLLDF